MALKRAVGRMVPYPLIETARRVIHGGSARRCPVCGAGVRRFLTQGYGYPVLEELDVVGGLTRPEDVCPICHAQDRDRLVHLYLERVVFAEPRPLRVLHMAPEKGLSRYLMRQPGVTYTAADIEPGRYRHLPRVERMSLTELPLEDGSVDLLLCNHVLEHIPDDARAMAEIARVLSPKGRAILQVPLSTRLTETREGDGSERPEEKIRLYGQDDHVRIYAFADYTRRLEAAGLRVDPYRAFEAEPELAAERSLNPAEVLHVCRRA